MPLTVAALRRALGQCQPDDEVVLQATVADGSVIGVHELDFGFDQGGPNGEGVEVVIGWEPGAEVIAPREVPNPGGFPEVSPAADRLGDSTPSPPGI
jgi:hypothetical protein